MSHSRETHTQYGYKEAGQGWTVGGWTDEGEARDFERQRVRSKEWHKEWWARYVWYKYRNCVVGPHGGVCWNTWEPQYWTAGLGTVGFEQPSFSAGSDPEILVEIGEDVWKRKVENYKFGAGVAIAGLSLDTQTGYSTNTQLHWLGVPAGNNCRRHLWAFKAVSQASRLWTRNVNCHVS